MRKLAKEHNVSDKTIRRVVKDLAMTLKAKVTHHLISETATKKRKERCCKLLNILKHTKQPIIMFSDEKIFTGPSCCEIQNIQQNTLLQ